MGMAKSPFFFAVAGLCEIGGGYLVRQWVREGKHVAFGLVGAAVLFRYGVIPTLQPANFGRVYDAYGGVFIVLSILWGGNRQIRPDKFDLVGGSIALLGVLVIMYWPRN